MESSGISSRGQLGNCSMMFYHGHVKTIEKLKIIFHQKMSHTIGLKVTEFQWSLLITLVVADEKLEVEPKSILA